MRVKLVCGLLAAVAVWAGLSATADAGDKVTLCHAAGQAGTTQFVTAAFGQAGHFNEDGTPAAGHEDDYLGACVTPTTVPPTTVPPTVPTTTVPPTTVPPTTVPPTTVPTTVPPTTVPPTTIRIPTPVPVPADPHYTG